MLINIPVRFHDYRLNTFLVTCNTSWKLQILTKSRAITLKILNISTWKYPGAQLHIKSNIPVRFHDSRSKTFWATCDTSWKFQIFTKSRAITLTKQNKSTNKTPCAQFYMLSNISVRLHDSRSNTYWVMCDTNWKL
jgi:hypothetical protein